jgi:hypothetical protein
MDSLRFLIFSIKTFCDSLDELKVFLSRIDFLVDGKILESTKSLSLKFLRNDSLLEVVSSPTNIDLDKKDAIKRE